MKKLILIIALATVNLAVNAQSLQLFQRTDSLPAASSYTFTLGANDPIFVYEFIVKNVSANTVITKVRKTELVNAGHDMYFCYGATCYIPTTVVSGTVSIGAGNQLPNGNGTYGIRTDFDPLGNTGISTVRYKVYNSANGADSAAVTITYNVLANSINTNSNSIFVSNPSPNPSSTSVSFSYNLNGIGEAAVVKIYNALGSLVKTTSINSPKSSVQFDVSDLEEGFYFYTVTANGRNAVTKKFIIER